MENSEGVRTSIRRLFGGSMFAVGELPGLVGDAVAMVEGGGWILSDEMEARG